MDLTMDDVAVLFYNYAVILTAAYAPIMAGIEDRFMILALGLVFALFWTGYFRYSIQPRFTDSSDESPPQTEQ
ncbi:hypothetical protein [Natronolimnobius baerhuensis]|uniref:DUF8074 domain-containing protein n=1 Tax=Natronolimnobius baerhuensis TaxID=253108 RepID=A0A202E4W0_9EURY|nr:hypothetical protein [Natronolimnobius baerhuensis]OVE83271.1 hypothetical protein B2G88_17905 [Natronolimnobius baerhuensis]